MVRFLGYLAWALTQAAPVALAAAPDCRDHYAAHRAELVNLGFTTEEMFLGACSPASQERSLPAAALPVASQALGDTANSPRGLGASMGSAFLGNTPPGGAIITPDTPGAN